MKVNTQNDNPIENVSFETALARLEQILEKMNSQAVPLEEALNLYKEADQLITTCNQRLNNAEQQIEVLIKNRAGEVNLTAEGKPMLQDFNPTYNK